MSKKNFEVLQENNLQYKISQEKRLVKCTIYAHGVFYTAQAKCVEGDTFDVEFGKRLAYLRAIKKMKLGEIKFFNAYLAELKQLPTQDEIQGKIDYLGDGVKNLDTKIADLLKH